MGAVIAAVFVNHRQAVQVREQFADDGFPTDRTYLTSREELGQVALLAEQSVSAKLTHHFLHLFSKERTAQELTRAVVAGRAVIVVHPCSEHEVNRTFELFREFGPSNLRHRGLENRLEERAPI
jgi:hypothetical protein